MKAREIVAEGFRTESTDEERELWRVLRARRFGGFEFRRDHPIGPYFADFCWVKRLASRPLHGLIVVCCTDVDCPPPPQRLIIELDGSHHGESL
jgi:very-short-patch-repair endonuclease